MKKVLLLVVLSLTVLTQAQRGARIAFIDMEYILESVPEYQKAQAQLEATVSKWLAASQSKQTEIDALKDALEKEKILLTPELIEDRNTDIAILEEELYQYQQKKFGADGDLIKRKKELIKPVQDEVFDVVQMIRKAKKYDYVFDKSSKEIMLIAANDKLDISNQVVKRLKSKQKQADIKRKRKKRNKGKSKTATPSKTQQKNIDARNKTQEARKKALEERKAAAAKAREERIKKAQELREQKIKAREERIRKAKEKK